MNILGLHFGHDASVAVLREGRLAACLLRERHSRIKHAISLQVGLIEAAVEAAGLTLDQIDHCAITSTQSLELVIDRPERFSIRAERHPADTSPSLVADLLAERQVSVSSIFVRSLLAMLYDPAQRDTLQHQLYREFFPEHRGRRPEEFSSHPWVDAYVSLDRWEGMGLEAIGAMDASAQLGGQQLRHGYHLPVTVRLAGREVPGSFVSHHMAHAAGAYYASPFAEGAILTHDGFSSGQGDLSGLFCYGQGNRIFPLIPHHLAMGALYEWVGVSLNLGPIGSAGKLMGLASYGRPRFFDHSFVGNWHDWQQRQRGLQGWLDHCVQAARRMGYDMGPLGDRSRMTAPINADIAASTQKLFEETFLLAAECLSKMLATAGRSTSNLCLSGGCALNCPSNTRVAQEGPFASVFVPPGCDDSGLAMGAALFLHHTILDRPRLDGAVAELASPYLGLPIAAGAVEDALRALEGRVAFERCADAAASAAQDLAADRVIGWFEGQSEIGPRALGHRSILADCRQGANWERVNKIKGREAWRPFAPAVLAAEADKWFRGCPLPSPYMLFTAQVRSERLPAITHADGSARLQTVDASCGEFFRLLEAFFKTTGVPVVLNTSFNGPGEPIVESPADALRFFAGSELDVLYLEGFRVTRTAPL